MNKICFKCLTDKPLTDFYKHKAMADGHLNKCKECTKKDVKLDRIVSPNARAYDRKRYYENPERHAYQVKQMKEWSENNHEKALCNARKWYQNNTEKALKIKKEWSDRNPIKRKAQIMAANAIKYGKLIKMPCEICGNDKVQAHHCDYTKPLDIMWLCTKHHGEWHRHNKPIVE